jgi:hypothetical protein
MGGLVPYDLRQQTYVGNSNEMTSKYYYGIQLATDERSMAVDVFIASFTNMEEHLLNKIYVLPAPY